MNYMKKLFLLLLSGLLVFTIAFSIITFSNSTGTPTITYDDETVASLPKVGTIENLKELLNTLNPKAVAISAARANQYNATPTGPSQNNTLSEIVNALLYMPAPF